MAYDEELANRIREQVQGRSGLSEKRMFGGLAFLINGNMAVSANRGGGLTVRVNPAAGRSWWTARESTGSSCAAGRWMAGSASRWRG